MSIKKVSGTISKIDEKTYKFIPDNKLNGSSKYFINATSNIKNINDVDLIPFKSEFVTKSGFYVTNSVPTNNDTNIELDAVIDFYFNLPVNESTINSTNIKLTYELVKFEILSVIPTNGTTNFEGSVQVTFSHEPAPGSLINNLILERFNTSWEIFPIDDYSINENVVTINTTLWSSSNYRISANENILRLSDSEPLDTFESTTFSTSINTSMMSLTNRYQNDTNKNADTTSMMSLTNRYQNDTNKNTDTTSKMCSLTNRYQIDVVENLNTTPEMFSFTEQYGEINTIDTMIGYYPFNGNHDDESGNDKHLTNTNAVLTKDINDEINRAYYLNGLALLSQNSIDFNLLTDEFNSISGWFKIDNANSYPFLFSSVNFGVEIYNNYVGYWTNSADIYGCSYIPDGNWVHMAFVIKNNDISNCKIYINGIDCSMSQIIGSTNNANCKLSNSIDFGGWSTYKLDGKIDNIRLYNFELTQEQVTEIYNLEKAFTINNMLGFFTFDNTLDDESSN